MAATADGSALAAGLQAGGIEAAAVDLGGAQAGVAGEER